MKQWKVGEILVRQGAVTAPQLEAALRRQVEQGGRLGEALLALGHCSESQVYRALSEQFDMPFVDLEEDPPPPSVLRLLPRADAVRLGVVPVRVENGRLLAVARNAFDFNLDGELRKLVRRPVLLATGVPSQIDACLESYGTVRPGAAPSAADRLAALNQEVERALRTRQGELRLAIEGAEVRVSIARDGEETLLARVPLDRLQILLDAPRLSGLLEDPTPGSAPPMVRFARRFGVGETGAPGAGR